MLLILNVLNRPGQLTRYSYWLLAGPPRIYSRLGQDIFLFYRASGSTEPAIQRVPGAKVAGREAYHSPLPSADVKNGGVIPPLRIGLDCVVHN
jgi:hypothetical protein